MGVSDLQSGRVYKITNVKTPSFVVDLSGANNREIIGYSDNGGQNQRWMLERENDGWTLRNLANGKYAGVENFSDANGAKVIAVDQQYTWHIWHEDQTNHPDRFRISVPGVKKSFDLSNHGAGPDIEIWGAWKGENQLWTFDEV
ncbi:hypothetical protein NP233_g495 [Leucocoprinus birnbaumii]|uniref:Ricin B lectin domain-containing protein n=1 Tax=Leucocoprinus birnbaumii TaxID=56174 RepID=A0AAD5YWN2_9AGAR|nr:hypothetical protein NP233_g495 [Leucocoprinus birnbaumii]